LLLPLLLLLLLLLHMLVLLLTRERHQNKPFDGSAAGAFPAARDEVLASAFAVGAGGRALLLD